MGVVIPGAGCGARNSSASGAQVIDGSLNMGHGDGSDVPYLTRTNSSTGNRRTWTFSGWVKRTSASNTESDQIINYANTTTSSSGIEFGDYDTSGYASGLRFNSFNSGNDMDLWSAGSYRDLLGWYHILEIYDSTEATESNRVKMYVNGEYITDWRAASYPANRWPSQNAEGPFCYAGSPGGYIGAYYWSTSVSNWKANIYASQFYLLDGTIAGPENFGFTDPLTNVWRPKKYEVKAPNRVGKFFSANFAASDGFQAAHPKLNAFNGGAGPVDVGRSACSSSGCTLTLSSIDVTVNHKLEIWSGYGSASVNGGAAVDFSGSDRGWQNLSFTGALSSIAITGNPSGGNANAGELYAVRVDGVILLDNGGYGTTGFYLPFDGSAPIGQDQSGSGNDWTPINFGGSTVIPKATGALPILNTVSGGKVAAVGVRTDPYYASLVLALPLVGDALDVSNQINSGSTTKTMTANGNAAASSDESNFYGVSYYFDGNGDYLSTPDSTEWHLGTSEFTIECFIRKTANGTNNYDAAIATGVNGSYHDGWSFLTSTGDDAFRTSDGATGYGLDFKNNSFTTDGKWHHIAVSRDSSDVARLFLDGILQDEETWNFSIPDSATPLYVGAQILDPGSVTFSFNGYIQDVRIYKGVAKYTKNFIPASTNPDVLPDTSSGVALGSLLTKITDGAVNFDGSSSYLSLVHSTDFDLTNGDFTLEGYFNHNHTSGYITGLGVWREASGADYWSYDLRMTQGGTVPAFIWTTDGTTVSGTLSATTPTANSGWHHIAVTRSGTSLRIFVDGVLEASTTTSDTFNTASQQPFICGWRGSSYYNGFMSNVRLIKGTALYTANFTPPTAPLTDITNTKLLCCQSNTSAIAYEVSPGTITANGDAAATNFNPFTDNINTVMGKETGYATLNPLDTNFGSNLQDGNLKAVGSSSWGAGHARGTFALTSGTWYWEGTKSGGSGAIAQFGFANTSASLSESYGSVPANSWTFYFGNGTEIIVPAANSSGYFGGSAMADGDTAGVALDMDNGTWQFFKNGVGGVVKTLVDTDSASTASITELYPWVGAYSSNVDVNFGQKPFKYAPPEGYQPLNAANLQSPGVLRPADYVGISTWTGDGSTDDRVISTNFQPDLIWSKTRTVSAYHNNWFDSVRGLGAQNALVSDSTGAAGAANGGRVKSVNGNGITWESGGGAYAAAWYNESKDYVSWYWKAGGNKNTFNVDDVGYASAADAGLDGGSINPTGASVGTKQGFSIIQYTGNNSNVTISHGLSEAPTFIIQKFVSGGGNWNIYHQSIGNTKRLTFTTDAESTGYWNSTNPTASVFSIGSGINDDGVTMIAYLWHDVPGLQKFGSYTGNQSTDGPYVELGFRPAILMIKSSSASSTNWRIIDDTRRPYNWGDNDSTTEGGPWLKPNTAAVEADERPVDLLSNGFKIQGSWGGDINYDSGTPTYIYAAWAHQPTNNLYGAQSNAR